jgi:hypothetical protein
LPEVFAHKTSPEARTAFIDTFADDAGHRREIDRPLLAHMLGVNPGARPPGVAHEAAVWWALHDADPRGSLAGIDLAGDERLFPSLRDVGIERWTEAEFAGVHALSWLAGREPGAIGRSRRAAMWLMREVQPDNGTHRPWATHLFVMLAGDLSLDATDRAEADLYAQTLLHNALAGAGRVDRFSACILWDSAAWLEAHAGINGE